LDRFLSLLSLKQLTKVSSCPDAGGTFTVIKNFIPNENLLNKKECATLMDATSRPTPLALISRVGEWFKAQEAYGTPAEIFVTKTKMKTKIITPRFTRTVIFKLKKKTKKSE